MDAKGGHLGVLGGFRIGGVQRGGHLGVVGGLGGALRVLGGEMGGSGWGV